MNYLVKLLSICIVLSILFIPSKVFAGDFSNHYDTRYSWQNSVTKYSSKHYNNNYSGKTFSFKIKHPKRAQLYSNTGYITSPTYHFNRQNVEAFKNGFNFKY